MPGWALLLVMALICGIVGASYSIAADTPADSEWLRKELTDSPTDSLPANQARPVLHPSINIQSLKPHEDSALGLVRISDNNQHSQNTRATSSSNPRSQAHGYQGNRYRSFKLPLDNDGYLIVALEKLRFTRGELILIVASLQGPRDVGYSLQATLEHAQTGEAIATTPLESSDSSGYYDGSLESDEAPGEYRLVVEATVDGKPVRHVSTLTIEPYLGDFKGLGTTYLDSNHLVIPVHFSSEKAGHYILSAQLYDGPTSIAHIQTEQRLDIGTNTFGLKVHRAAFANREVQGQLKLQHLQIRQLPSSPGERTNYAFGPEEGYSFSPPDLGGFWDASAIGWVWSMTCRPAQHATSTSVRV